MPYFFIAFLTVMALLHLYVYRRLVLRCDVCRRYLQTIKYLLTVNFFAVVLYMLSRLISALMVFHVAGSVALGILVALVVATLFFELLMMMHRVVPLDVRRRAFLKKSSEYSALLFAAGYTGSGMANNIQEPALVHVRVDQGMLTAPVRIVQLSDLHITEVMEESFISKLVARIEALNPDIIAITGDLIDAKIERVEASLAWLGKLKARYGVYFVTGNHEFYIDVHAITRHLESLGIIVMDNQSLFIEPLGITIVGLPDFEARRFDWNYEAPDIAKATASMVPNAPILLLAHQPRMIEHLGTFKPHLTLSGHTHGGQLFPFNFFVPLQQPFVKGLHAYAPDQMLYINSGTGFWGPPMRLGTTSELTFLEWR